MNKPGGPGNPCGGHKKKVYCVRSKPLGGGLTLMELAVVLAVMAALAGVVYGSFGWMERKQLTDTARRLADDIRYAQRMAIIEGQRFTVYIDALNGFYEVARRKPKDVVKTVYLPRGIHVAMVNNPVFDYLPRGTVSDGFTVWLASGKYWQRLTAVPSAGRVEVKPVIMSENGKVPPVEGD